jgi:hypothetical protein
MKGRTKPSFIFGVKRKNKSSRLKEIRYATISKLNAANLPGAMSIYFMQLKIGMGDNARIVILRSI